MITLSANFIARAAADDTRRIVLAHLYYDGSNYLKVATVASVIDSAQYYGVINNISSISQKWNVTGNNSVTISAPKITLGDYQTPDGITLQEDFFSKTYYGRRLKIYLTYEGLSLADALQVFDGTIDDINLENNNIVIKGKTTAVPDKDIQGRKLNFEDQTIGDDAVPSGYEITEDLDGKYLPIPFGQHWCAPLVPYLKGNNTDHDRIMASYDVDYIGIISNWDNIRSDMYQYNVGLSTESILLANDDFFTPMHKQDWTSDILDTYEVITPGTLLPGIKVIFGSSNGHLRSDGQIYLTVPLRYRVRDDLANWFSIRGEASFDADTLLEKIFNPGTVALPWNMVSDRGSPFNIPLHLWVKLELNAYDNLRTDEDGLVRIDRKIHIPSTDSLEGGQGWLLGKWKHNVGSTNLTGDQRKQEPVFIHHWLGDERSEAYTTPTYSGQPNYIGAGRAWKVSGSTPYEYNLNARVFTDGSGYDYYITENPDPADMNSLKIGLQGDADYPGAKVIGEQGKAPFIIRESFLNGIVGCALDVQAQVNTPGGDDTFSLYRLYHLTHGSIDFPTDASAYASMYGLQLTSSDSMLSTQQNQLTRVLLKPYEYIELLLRKTGLVDADFHESFEYANIDSKWDSLFGNKRDFSGFVIDDKITLDKFIKDYVKDEPFTVYASEDGQVHIPMFQRQYVANDIQASLDYDDAKKFNISMTPTKNIVTAIDSLQTDYQYGLDSYASDLAWRLDEIDYDYGFWKFGNAYDDNEFSIESIEKKYTSCTRADLVTYSSRHWGCLKTHTNVIPGTDVTIWRELLTNNAVNAWSSSTEYSGVDSESYALAKFILNSKANRHRIIKFETDNLSYLRFSIGDVVDFTNVPHTLIGMAIKGFNGNTNFEAIVNGQTVYAAFIITNISKSLTNIKIEAIQAHDLDAYAIVKG